VINVNVCRNLGKGYTLGIRIIDKSENGRYIIKIRSISKQASLNTSGFQPRILTESKAISITGRSGLADCELLRIEHCLDIAVTDGSKDVSLRHQPPLLSPETLFFCFW
jgi:hypothetical protein